MNNRLKIILIAILVSLGLYFLIRQTFALKQGGRGNPAPTVVQTPAQPVNQPPTPPTQFDQTQEANLAAITGEVADIINGKKPVNLDNIDWTRPYLAKYKGIIPDNLLYLLNKLLQADDGRDGKALNALLASILGSVDKIKGPLSDIVSDETNSEYMRMLCMEMLGQGKIDKAATEIVAKQTEKGVADRLRSNAITAFGMGNFNRETKAKVLRKIAYDKTDPERSQAMTFLRGDPSEKTNRVLHEVLADSNETQDTRMAAAYAISGSTKDTAESAQLLMNMINDPKTADDARNVAIKSLDCLDRQKAEEVIVMILSDVERKIWPGVATRQAAALIADDHKNEKVANLLLDRLFDRKEDPITRNACALSLKRHGTNEVAFQRILSEFPNQDVDGIGCIVEYYFVGYNDQRALPVLRKWLEDHPKDWSGVSKRVNNGIRLLEKKEGRWRWEWK
ncbi:MAG: hypothetical protein PHW04_11645 [Candidatus Wallbacteria bacterium]|nr:hypothetical protein [Candidatus Wallbacteria bacterium]